MARIPFILLALLLLSIGSLQAKEINGVSIVVNDEVITLYDIQTTVTQRKISQKNAIEALVRDRLEIYEAQKRNIAASGFDVTKEIERISTYYNISSRELFKAMEKRGVSEEEYENSIKKELTKKLLYRAISMSKIEQPTKQDIEEYYELYKEEFQRPQSINVIAYLSESPKAIQEIQKNPMLQTVEVITENITFESSKTNPQLFSVLSKTSSGEFTPIAPNNNKFVSFLVRSKSGAQTISLADAQKEIVDSITSKESNRFLNDYFQKLRATANIKILREPN